MELGARFPWAELFSLTISNCKAYFLRVLAYNCHHNLSLDARFNFNIDRSLAWSCFELLPKNGYNRVILSNTHDVAIPSITVAVSHGNLKILHLRWWNWVNVSIFIVNFDIANSQNIYKLGDSTIPFSTNNCVTSISPRFTPRVFNDPVTVFCPSSQQDHMVNFFLVSIFFTAGEYSTWVEKESISTALHTYWYWPIIQKNLPKLAIRDRVIVFYRLNFIR